MTRPVRKTPDAKPLASDRDGVSIRWTETPDNDRLQRIAEILADILDNPATPAEPEQP